MKWNTTEPVLLNIIIINSNVFALSKKGLKFTPNGTQQNMYSWIVSLSTLTSLLLVRKGSNSHEMEHNSACTSEYYHYQL